MFLQVINVEQRKLFKRNILWIELALLALAVVGLYIIGYVVFMEGSAGVSQMEAEQALAWPAGLTNSLAVAAGPNLGGLLMIILVGAVVAQEYSWGSVQLWLSQGIPRPLLLVAKFLALMVPAFLLVLTTILAGGLVSAVLSFQLLGNLPIDQVAWGEFGQDALLIAYSLLPYGALTFFLAVASRSTVVSIGGGLTYTLLLEGIVLQVIGSLGGVWGEIGRYLPGGLAHGLLATEAGITVEVDDALLTSPQFLEPGIAAIGIAMYVVTFFVISMILFRRQDLSA